MCQQKSSRKLPGSLDKGREECISFKPTYDLEAMIQSVIDYFKT
jgi:hypothetical protein